MLLQTEPAAHRVCQICEMPGRYSHQGVHSRSMATAASTPGTRYVRLTGRAVCSFPAREDADMKSLRLTFSTSARPIDALHLSSEELSKLCATEKLPELTLFIAQRTQPLRVDRLYRVAHIGGAQHTLSDVQPDVCF